MTCVVTIIPHDDRDNPPHSAVQYLYSAVYYSVLCCCVWRTADSSRTACMMHRVVIALVYTLCVAPGVHAQLQQVRVCMCVACLGTAVFVPRFTALISSFLLSMPSMPLLPHHMYTPLMDKWNHTS